MHFLTLSAEQGYKVAQFKLASIHQKGEIVSKSYPLAIYWFKQCLKDDNKNEKQCAEAKEHVKCKSNFFSKIEVLSQYIYYPYFYHYIQEAEGEESFKVKLGTRFNGEINE